MISICSKARAGALAGAVALVLSFAAQAQDLNFDIPAGDLNAALSAYSKQTGQQVVFKIDDLKGKTTPGVHGAMSPEQALTALLAGTGLKVNKDPSGAIAIFPAEAVAGGASTKTAGDDQKLEEVIVTATAISSIFVTSRSATRIDADPMGLPMTISAVQADLLRQQQARTVAEALNNVAGMDVVADDRVYSRGFDVSFARNGTTAFDLLGNTRTRPVVATERLEVVKGPEQIMQGSAASYGGTVNVITKVPEPGEVAYFGLGLGSREYWRLDADLNDTLVEGDYGRLMGRLIGSFQDQGDTVVGYPGRSDNFASAGLRWDNEEWGSDLSVVYEYNDYWTPHLPYVVTTGKSFGQNLRQFNFGVDGTDYGTEATDDTIDVNFTQTLVEGWRLSVNYIWEKTVSGAQSLYLGFNAYDPYAPDIAFGSTDSDNWKPSSSSSNYWKVNLYGTFATGPVSHNLLIAYDYSGTVVRVPQQPLFGPDCITNVVTWTKQCTDPGFQIYGSSKFDVSDTGVLASDRLQWDKWSALLGLRWIDNTAITKAGALSDDEGVIVPARTSKRPVSQTLPQYGLVYEAAPDVSLYASGNEGFASNADLKDKKGEQIPDQTSTQYEAGVKALLLDRQIAVTLSLYQIKQKNVAVADLGATPPPGQDIAFMLIDGITSEGVEVEVSGQPVRGLELRANYAYLSTKAETEGTRLTWGYTPNKFNLWGAYWFSRTVGTGWWAGGGLNYSQAPKPGWEYQPYENPDFYDPPVTVVWPKFSGNTMLDLSAGWTDSHWSAVAGIKNVTDVRVYDLPAITSFVTTVSDGGRTYAFDVSYSF